MTDTADTAVPQNPMQPHIQGYREFDRKTSDQINAIKQIGDAVIQPLLDECEKLGATPRELALAKTHLQQGAMWLIRSIAQPKGLF